MEEIYVGREQTAAKHIILRKYLQTLAFKLLNGGYPTLTYVDGFSGPWEAQTADYSDTSFMIAIDVLKDAQRQVKAATGKYTTIRCFFVEQKRSAYSELYAAVMKHHAPDSNFHVHTFHGHFKDAVDPIMNVIGNSFALTFIDPKGWTGYEFAKIAPIMQHKRGEVLLNYMFDFINRFTAWDDPKIAATFDGILGDQWNDRLDQTLPRDEGVRKLFEDEFRKAGQFKHVLFTPIEKLAERTHFCLVYGTRNSPGLEAYRDVEYAAMKEHGLRRMEAKQAHAEAKSGQSSLFSIADLQPDPPIDTQVAEFRCKAQSWLHDELQENARAFPFSEVWPPMIETFMLKKKDAKRVCVDMAKKGIIKETWRQNGSRRLTPGEEDLIELCEL